MNLLKLLGLTKDRNKDLNPPKDILYLWEDDYLMIELLPNENLEFVEAETKRTTNFAQEHFDGIGFTDITPIADKPIKTIEKLINITDVEQIMTQAGLNKVNQFFMQGVGLLKDDKVPLGFGTNKFAVICDKQNGVLKNIWLTGHTKTEDDKQKLIDALLSFGQAFNFIGINWFRGTHHNLVKWHSVDEFVKNSC